jgi:RAB6A-GEF complex partner protein 1
VYVAKDYAGNISFSHRISHPQAEPVQTSTSHRLNLLFSPDGYALFAASHYGWSLWSVYGHLLASSSLERSTLSSASTNNVTSAEHSMNKALDCCWTSSGLGIIFLGTDSRSLYMLPLARSAVTTCYNPVFFPVVLPANKQGHSHATSSTNGR